MKCFSALLLLLPLLALAEPAATPAQLEQLKKRIATLSDAQSKDLKNRDQLQHALRETELRISKLAQQQRQLDRNAAESEQRLAQLQQDQAALAREKATQLDWLAKTVRASYQSGREERIKLLLNQQQPDQLARLLRYQEYFQRARSARLDQVGEELSALTIIAEDIHRTRAELSERRQQLREHARRQQSAQQERQQALAKLNRSLQTREADIDALQQDQQRLQTLLDKMNRSLADIPAELDGSPFAEMADKLPWPVSGAIRTPFNSSREGALRWQGVIMEAAAGTPVRAIHGGRVVFSDWLRGYGLLTIIDHGKGYLSLYGHNQSLLREVGDWVRGGDVLALAGNSGGNSSSGLYFEIRHRGKAVNPTRWCNRRVTLPPLARN